MSSFSLTIKNKYFYYGYPESRKIFDFKSDWLRGSVDYYGNHGFENPNLVSARDRKTNGYFWELHSFMKDFYSENSKIQEICRSLKEGEEKTIILEY